MGDEGAGAIEFLTGFSAGSRIAGYRLEEQIGQGGMAVVFRAQDERLRRQVALKILSPALMADEDFRHRFIRESRSAAAVDDPHIIPVFEAREADGVLFIAMRYVPDGDAGTLVRRLGPLPISRAAAIISAVASALDAAHVAGLVHRDVKPANMLVAARPGLPDHVYLSDFGLTKGSWSSASLTSTGHFMGTLDYCAPEQIRGEQVDGRTDQYALACAAFMLLSGKPPFHRDEGMAVLYAQLSAPPPLLTSQRPDLPATVDEVFLRALAKAPEDRYATCGEFADALRTASGLQRYNSGIASALSQQVSTGRVNAPVTDDRLAAARRRSGRSDEAIELYQRTLVDQQHTLGPEHPDTLETRINIAREMAACGDHAGAEEEFRDVLAARQRTLGPDHPETLLARFSVAQQMAARGDHVAAEQEFRGILPHLRHKLGPDHPDTLAAQFSIAREMAARGDHAGAQEEFRNVLPQLEQTLGRDHPVTLIARFNIAQETAARGDHVAAEQEFRRILPHLRRKLGPDHPDTLAAAKWIEALAEGECLDV
jgi:serine/threonine protein kinase